MIDPNNTNTIRVGELPSEPFNLNDNIPHEVGTDLKRGTVQQLADFIATVIEVTGGVGFRAVSVTDGQTLPTTTQQEFILVGKGTYFNVAGGDTIELSKELNALVSNGSFWFVGVEIPINVELAGITQEVREGFLNTTPSEDAVFKFIENLDLSTKEDSANKQNSLAVDGTGVKFPTVDAVNTGLSTKISGSGTTNFLPKFGVNGLENSSLKEENTFIKSTKDLLLNSGNYVILGNENTGIFYAIGYEDGLGQFVFRNGRNGQVDLGINNLTQNIFTGTTDNEVDKLQIGGTISASPATLSNQVVVKSQLDLKADLASPSLTGTPTAPTATAGTNTTQIATTAFVGSAVATSLSNVVTLTGNQSISGLKSFNNGVSLSSSLSAIIMPTNNVLSISGIDNAIARVSDKIGIKGDTNKNFIPALLNTSLISASPKTFDFPNQSGTFALKSDLLYTNQTITANKTVTIAEFVNNNELILSVNATSGNITITLPTFTALQGYKVTVKKMDSSANSVTITGVGGVNIDGAATLVISGQYSKATIGSNLSQYIIL